MNGDDTIIQLLTEIRDNQQRQLDAHQKSTAFYHAVLARQQRRFGIIGAVIGGLVGWLIYLVTTK